MSRAKSCRGCGGSGDYLDLEGGLCGFCAAAGPLPRTRTKVQGKPAAVVHVRVALALRAWCGARLTRAEHAKAPGYHETAGATCAACLAAVEADKRDGAT